MVAHPRRHEPCLTLHERGIPCLVWFEDAIAPYGVPTVVFDLHLLVPDIDEAARALIEKGWIDAGLLNSDYHFLMGPISQRRLHPPNYTPPNSEESSPWPPPPPSQDPPGPTTTVLLPAVDWNVPIEKLRLCSPASFVPPLDLVLDGMIDSFLDSPSDTLLRTRLTTYLSYLYGYCKALKTPAFAANLRLDHRQFHYDRLSRYTGPVPFIKEQRQIRDEIREGKRQPHLDMGLTRSEPNARVIGEPTQDELLEIDRDG
ncbi:hypothetical protein QBC40DRAFT_289071 [Triangularia verruculosa]|uniref:Uncharacterized protein n=1 Tax=Triangularia verruculosa TaxID=2587418 RepID=A0AAN6X8J1_9PEZI|nr:hypothetical protein QBC40DRAFT_289071 [Triangularia verruculosa]